MSKQKHDLGRIKKSSPKVRPTVPRSERNKARSKRVQDNYARAEALFQQAEQERRNKERRKP